MTNSKQFTHNYRSGTEQGKSAAEDRYRNHRATTPVEAGAVSRLSWMFLDPLVSLAEKFAQIGLALLELLLQRDSHVLLNLAQPRLQRRQPARCSHKLGFHVSVSK